MSKEEWVLITGASSGLGYALAKKFIAEGYFVIATARRKERLETLAKCCPTNRFFSIVADLNSEEEILSLVRQVFVKTKYLDVVINNAGYGKEEHFIDMDYDSANRMVKINCLAPVYLTWRLLPSMLERKCGIIINISSTGGVSSLRNLAVYGATKHFLNGFTKNLHRELKGSGVRVYAFMPGAMDTEFSQIASGAMNSGGENPEKIACSIYNKVKKPTRWPLIIPTFNSFLTVVFDSMMRALNLR